MCLLTCRGKREAKSYKHEMKVEDIVEWAVDYLPKREEGIDASSFETFLQKQAVAAPSADGKQATEATSMKPTAVIFVDDDIPGGTENDATPMVRSLAYQHKDMTFGIMQVEEAKKMKNMEFGQLFKKDPPHLLLMVLAPQQGADGKEGMGLNFQPYMGKWKADKLGRFLNMHDKTSIFDDIGTDPETSLVEAEVVKINVETPPKVACHGARICAIALLDTYVHTQSPPRLAFQGEL